MAASTDPENLPQADRNQYYHTQGEQLSRSLKQVTAEISTNAVTLLKPSHLTYLKNSVERVAQTATTTCEVTKTGNFIVLHGIIECALELCQEALQLVKNTVLRTQSLKPDSDDYDDEICLFKKKIAIFASKISLLEEFITNGKNLPIDDLWSQSQTSPAWQTVRKFTRYCEFERVEKSIRDYNKKGEIVYHLLAAMGRGAHQIPETSEEADRFLDAAWTQNPQFPIVIRKSKPVDIERLDNFSSKLVPRIIYYLAHKEKGIIDGSFFVANPEPQIIRMLFNFKDKKTMKFISAIKAEIEDTDAETDIKHYLNPNLFQNFLKRSSFNEPLGPFKLESQGGKIQLTKNQLLHGGLLTECKQQAMRIRLLYHRELKQLKPSLKSIITSLIDALQTYNGPTTYVQPAGSYRDPQGFPFPKQASSNVQFGVDFQPPTEKFLTEEEKKDFERVIIHVHGGGFVAQSSSTHKGYLNPWTNTFKRPIFSIDYRLADKNVHFPEPLNDVISGYIWVLNYLEFVLQVVPKQIILLGDSAGAGLNAGLIAWCITNGLRKPDATMMYYPAINASPTQFTPSVLHSLDDRFLNYSSLKMCGLYYVDNAENPCENPYLNLTKLPTEVMAQFPPTEIFIGDRDPLRDDTVRFALKMFNAQVKVKLNILKGLSHALLSNSGNSGIDGANSFREEAQKALSRVLAVPLA